MAKRKLKTLDLQSKINLIAEIEKGGKKKDIALKFGIRPNTLSTIWSKRERLREKYQSVGTSGQMKRDRACTYDDIDIAVYKWFVTMRGNNLPVSGPLLKEKATAFSKIKNYQDFKASDGWLHKFKLRHGIVGKLLCGESASVDQEQSEQWINEKLPTLLSNYSPDDIFNADETGLFYKCLPNRTLAFKGEKCFGGKHSKERITCLVGANMSGSEKLKPFIIGKSAKPRCFQQLKTLPVEYVANKRAWMTGDIFSAWLIKLDKQFVKQKRQVLFFIDNCPAHSKEIAAKLKSIRLEYFPPNMTSKVQPMDMGIIQNLKVQFRRRILKKVLNHWETKKENYKISLLDCVREISKAWTQDVESATIRNCFKKSGFKSADSDWDDEDDLPLSSFLRTNVEEEIQESWQKLSESGYDIGDSVWKDYIQVDDNILITDFFDEVQILEDVFESTKDGEETDEEILEETDIQVPTKQKIDEAISTLQSAIETTTDVPDEVQLSLHNLEHFFNQKKKNLVIRQSKITDFLKQDKN